jgi:hypothetical protein
LAIRLNGTSDLPWEKIRATHARNLMEQFPSVQFYDYTKIPGRTTPDNYHLTFSEDEHNLDQCLAWLARGGNVASIFDGPMPSHHLGYPVVDGDAHDLRFLDPTPSVIGLKLKRTRMPLATAA